MAIACTFVGAFANEQGPPCHADGFAGSTLAGSYGGINLRFCLFGFCIEFITLFVYDGVLSPQD